MGETGALDSTTIVTPPARSSTGELKAADQPPELHRHEAAPPLVELVTYLLALVGAIAMGLGITEYFSDRPYVFGYLIAYAGFRTADVLIRPQSYRASEPYRPWFGSLGQLPWLVLFALPPFERTYLYGGEGPNWLGAIGLLIALAGLWIALLARLQQMRLTRHGSDSRAVIRRGLYRKIRHPIYAGMLLAMAAWPLEYGAPIAELITLAVGMVALRRRIEREESMLLARDGEEYAAYMKETDRLIPGVY